jgi:hypothetical protein
MLLFWQNIIWQWYSAVFMHFEHELYCFLKLSDVISVFPLGMVMSFNGYIINVYSLCSSFCVFFCCSLISLCCLSSHCFSSSVQVV